VLVEGPTQGVNDATDEFLPDRHVQDTARAVCEAAGDQVLVRAQQDHADFLGVQVVSQAEQPAVKAHQLLCLDAGQTADAGDA